MYGPRFEQTTNTQSTGTFDLVDPTTSARQSAVQAVGSGNPVWYVCETEDGTQWEEGWGVATAGTPDTLTRNVVRSSNANALVNFPTGTKRIWGGPNADSLRFGANCELPVAGGTANAITVGYKPACRVLRPGMRFAFVAAATNTGPVTIAIDSTGAKNLRKIDGNAPSGGEIVGGQVVDVIYGGANLILLSAPASRGAFVRKSASQSIANATPTILTWDTEERDTAGIHDNVTNSSRLTVPAGATRARASCNVDFANGAGSYRKLAILKNGANVNGMGFMSVAPAGGTQDSLLNVWSAELDVVGGDYFEAQVQQDSGGALNVQAGPFTWFQLEIVR